MSTKVRNVMLATLGIITLFLTIMLANVISTSKREINYLKENRTIVYNTDSIEYYSKLYQPTKRIILVKVLLRDKPTFFIVDTGSAFTIIDVNQIDDYGLKVIASEKIISGVGGLAKFYEVINSDYIVVGGVKYFQSIGALDISGLVSLVYETTGIRIAGLIGTDFLTDYGFVIDYNNNILFSTTKIK